MKKKIVLIALLVALVLTPAFSASKSLVSDNSGFAIGLNLGTNSGVGMSYKMKDFTLAGNVGFGLLNLPTPTLGVDVFALYDVAKIEIDRNNVLPISLGVGGAMSMTFDADAFGFAIAPLGMAQMAYMIPKSGFELYLRLGLGYTIGISNAGSGFGFSGAIGCLYHF